MRPPHGPPSGKWVTFAASCIIQACSGLSYSFSVYAPAVKARLGLDQVQLATVGSAVNLGGYFAVPSGLLYDCLKDHPVLGPRIVIALGSLCCVCGYLGLWLIVSGAAPGGFAEVVLFAICAGNAGTWYDTTALVTNVRNFPNSRGFVVGILKSFLGLSASVFSSVYLAFFAPDATTFLLVLASVPAAVNLVLGLAVNYVPFVEQNEVHRPAAADNPGVTPELRFLLIYCLVAAIACYQCLSAFLITHEALSSAARAGLAAGCLGLVSLVTLAPLGTGGWRPRFGRAHAEGDATGAAEEPPGCGGRSEEGEEDAGGAGAGGGCGADDLASPLLPPGGARPLPPPTAAASGSSAAAAPGKPAASGGAGSAQGGGGGGELPSLPPLAMAATLDFWCLFLQFAMGTGAALALLNNLGQLFVSLGGEPGGQVVVVSLFSVANAAGRLAMGFVPEHFLHARGTPRPVFLVIVAVLMSLASLAAAYTTLSELYLVATALGLLLGAHWSLAPSICSDLFGLAHFGSNYATMQFAPAAGSYLLATRLTGALYDRAAAAQGDPLLCTGPACFRQAFLILSGLSAASAVACVALAARSRGAYRLIARHLAQVEEAEEAETRAEAEHAAA